METEAGIKLTEAEEKLIDFANWRDNNEELINTTCYTNKEVIELYKEQRFNCPDCKGEGMIIEELSHDAPCCGRCDGTGKLNQLKK